MRRHPLLYGSRRQPSCRSDRCASNRSTPLETPRRSLARTHAPPPRGRWAASDPPQRLPPWAPRMSGCGWMDLANGRMGRVRRTPPLRIPAHRIGRKTPPRRPFYRGGLGLRAGRRGRRAGSHRSVGRLGAGGTCGIYRPSMWDTHRLFSVSTRSSRQNSMRAWPGRSRRVGYVAEALCCKRPEVRAGTMLMARTVSAITKPEP